MENFQKQKLSSLEVWRLLFFQIAGTVAIPILLVVLSFKRFFNSEKVLVISLFVFNLLVLVLALRFLKKQSGIKGFIPFVFSVGFVFYILLRAI